MTEIWKDIKGYEGLYQVSNLGNVKRIDVIPERMLNPFCDKGYKFVNLSKNNKYIKVSIHRLVAQAFIPNPKNLPFINHKDENKTNNCIYNLEWCDISYNNTYNNIRFKAGKKKQKIKNEEDIKYIIESKISCTILAKKYNVDRSTICNIRHKKFNYNFERN